MPPHRADSGQIEGVSGVDVLRDLRDEVVEFVKGNVQRDRAPR